MRYSVQTASLAWRNLYWNVWHVICSTFTFMILLSACWKSTSRVRGNGQSTLLAKLVPIFSYDAHRKNNYGTTRLLRSKWPRLERERTNILQSLHLGKVSCLRPDLVEELRYIPKIESCAAVFVCVPDTPQNFNWSVSQHYTIQQKLYLNDRIVVKFSNISLVEMQSVMHYGSRLKVVTQSTSV
jgi:hypothetical protein